MSSILVLLIAFCELALAQTATLTTSISLPSATSSSSRSIDRSFPGFGISTQDLVDYVGAPGSPNSFSLNLIKSVFSRTGGTPIIRVGGTHGDLNTQFTESGKYTGQKVGHEYLYSPVYFESFRNFLPDVKYIFQIPFRPMNVSNTVEFFQAGFNNIGPEGLVSVAIGNEEGKTYTSGKDKGEGDKGYVAQYLKYEQALFSRTNITKSVKFEIADGASKERKEGVFNAAGMFNAGVNNNGRVNAVAYHYYQPNGDNLQRVMMNHTAMLEKLSEYTAQIGYMTAKQPSIPYVFSEIGNGEEGHRPGRALQLSFGAALWQANIQLYCTAIGVGRMNFISSGTSGHNTWDAKPAQVRPAFYAHPFVADFIGNSTTQNTTSQVLLNTTLLTGYAAFDGPDLARVALVNFKLWPAENSTAGFSSPRPAAAVQLNGLPAGTTGVKVLRMTSDQGGYASDASVIEYDNTQWTVASNGVGQPTGNQTEMLPVNGSSVTVNVQDSEAVLVVLLK